jgi:hypothetical protein
MCQVSCWKREGKPWVDKKRGLIYLNLGNCPFTTSKPEKKIISRCESGFCCFGLFLLPFGVVYHKFYKGVQRFKHLLAGLLIIFQIAIIEPSDASGKPLEMVEVGEVGFNFCERTLEGGEFWGKELMDNKGSVFKIRALMPFDLSAPFTQKSQKNSFTLISGRFRGNKVTLPLTAFCKKMDNNPASDINSDDGKDADCGPICWRRLSMYHWIIILLVSFFNGAGMGAIWNLLKPQSDAKKRDTSSREKRGTHE